MTLPDPTTMIAAAATVLATLAAGARVVWAWLTSLIDRFQVEAANARKEFLEEAKAARTDFLAGLQKIEERRLAAEEKLSNGQTDIHTTLIALHTTIQERGVAAPQKATT